MRISAFLHKIVNVEMDKRRFFCLIKVIESVLFSKTLSVTSVGRAIDNEAQTRSNIRTVDRLYSNTHFLAAIPDIYCDICHFLINTTKPIILIDETKILNTKFYSLRGSLYAQGRSITICEVVFTRNEYGSEALYRRFMERLSYVLPSKCKPILVTDAGFKGSWFNLVLEWNWDFVGRLRGERKCRLGGEGEFYEVKGSKVIATKTPKYIGAGEINSQNPLAGNFYTVKQSSKGRHAYTRTGRHSETDKSKKHTRSANEPWLIFSSLKTNPKKIVKMYSLRMCIEENFRDTKSSRYGLSLDMTRTKNIARMQIILLIAALASMIAYIIGCVGEMKGWHLKFQSNSIKTKRVISRFFLGCQIIYRNYKLVLHDILCAIKQINTEMKVTI